MRGAAAGAPEAVLGRSSGAEFDGVSPARVVGVVGVLVVTQPVLGLVLERVEGFWWLRERKRGVSWGRRKRAFSRNVVRRKAGDVDEGGGVVSVIRTGEKSWSGRKKSFGATSGWYLGIF